MLVHWLQGVDVDSSFHERASICFSDISIWQDIGCVSVESNGAIGDVLILRHVVKLLALDLRLRIRVFTLRGPACKIRVKLLYSSILWNIYAVRPPPA